MRGMLVVGGFLVLSFTVVRVDAQLVDAQTQIYLRDLAGSIHGVAGSAIPPVAVLEGPAVLEGRAVVSSPVMLESPDPRIGATVRSLRPDEAAAAHGHGVVVERVAKDGPAFRAGLEPGDIILLYDFSGRGVDTDDTREFARRVHDTPPGGVLPLAVVRGGMRLIVSLVPESGRARFPKQL